MTSFWVLFGIYIFGFVKGSFNCVNTTCNINCNNNTCNDMNVTNKDDVIINGCNNIGNIYAKNISSLNIYCNNDRNIGINMNIYINSSNNNISIHCVEANYCDNISLFCDDNNNISDIITDNKCLSNQCNCNSIINFKPPIIPSTTSSEVTSSTTSTSTTIVVTSTTSESNENIIINNNNENKRNNSLLYFIITIVFIFICVQCYRTRNSNYKYHGITDDEFDDEIDDEINIDDNNDDNNTNNDSIYNDDEYNYVDGMEYTNDLNATLAFSSSAFNNL